MNNQNTLHSQSVQQTMLLPLWGRAMSSEKNPDILYDKTAIDIVKNFDFDFTSISNSFGEFSGICYVTRARKIDDTIKAYIKQHPNASIVNIGAGLDTTFSRVDNGKIHWYNLDLPDAISFRHQFIPEHDRNKSIAKSFLDPSWFDDIRYHPDDGIMFVSGGVFFYFKEEQLKEIFLAMAKRFPGGRLYFDAEPAWALKKSNDMVKKAGNNGAAMYFSVDKKTDLLSWSPDFSAVHTEPFFKKIPVNSNWSLSIKLLVKISDLMGMMKFVEIEFSK